MAKYFDYGETTTSKQRRDKTKDESDQQLYDKCRKLVDTHKFTTFLLVVIHVRCSRDTDQGDLYRTLFGDVDVIETHTTDVEITDTLVTFAIDSFKRTHTIGPAQNIDTSDIYNEFSTRIWTWMETEVVGSKLYSYLNQYIDESREADWYALGATLWEAFSGAKPCSSGKFNLRHDLWVRFKNRPSPIARTLGAMVENMLAPRPFTGQRDMSGYKRMLNAIRPPPSIAYTGSRSIAATSRQPGA